MADLATLYKDKQRFLLLIEDVYGVIAKIDKCVDKLTPVSDYLADAYSIDESRADESEIQKNLSELVNCANELTGNTIPAINEALNSVNGEIARLEREEQERREREAREAAERAAAQSASSSNSPSSSSEPSRMNNVSRGN